MSSGCWTGPAFAESLGEREKAIRSYQFVVDVWRGADPELHLNVVEARTALTRMKSPPAVVLP